MCSRLEKKRTLSCVNSSKIDRKRSRKVHFSSKPTNLHQLDREDDVSYSVDDFWYSRRELAVFTNEVRNHVLGFTHESIDENTRGYERYDYLRSQQKATTRKIILLLMQQKTLSDNEKSFYAGKSSAWSVKEAFVRGCMDFCDAYHPQSSHILELEKKETVRHTEIVSIATSNQKQNKKRKLNSHKCNEHCNIVPSAA